MVGDQKDSSFIPAGGLPEQFSLSLAIYGDGLDPSLITTLLGAIPTTSFCKGGSALGSENRHSHGAWILRLDGIPPTSPDDLASTLLRMVSFDSSAWQTIHKTCSVCFRFASHSDRWNHGFSFSSATLLLLAAIGCDLDFDLYFYGDDASSV